MSIYLYSDQVIPANRKIDRILIDEAIFKVKELSKVKVAYIPSGGDPDRTYYYNKVEYYGKYGIENFMFFDLDAEYDDSKLDDLMKSTIIHLSGGLPLILNKNVKQRGFGKFLVEYVKRGGIVVGVSAGAIQLTNSIGLYVAHKIGYEYEIENHHNSLTTSRILNFEFLPHLNRFSEEFVSGLKSYSDRYNTRLFCCKDGDGLRVDGEQIEKFGEIVEIYS